jgi:uncharacterized protein YjbI with pentapeptide repeats
MHRWPIDITALGASACAARLWQTAGARRLTVVAKALVELVHDGPAALIDGAEIVPKDRHYLSSPGRSVEAAGDLAPYLARCDVTVRGHAFAPPGQPLEAMTVRLAVQRSARLIDKKLFVYGDPDPAAPARRLPFQRMPLDYEHAFGGRGHVDNPVGRGAEASGPGARPPNVVDPADARRTAGFGPLSRFWGGRARALGTSVRALVDGVEPQIGDGFDWSYFQSAPLDQQIPYLAGDEWIVLDGMHPALPRVQTRLPGLRAAARIHTRAGGAFGPGRDLELQADTLAIDADRGVAALVWRGSVRLDASTEPSQLKAFVGVQVGDAPLAWPGVPAVDRGPAPSVAGRDAAPESFDETGPASPADVERGRHAATPFPGPTPVALPPAPAPSAPGEATPAFDETYKLSPRESQTAGKAKAHPFAPPEPGARPWSPPSEPRPAGEGTDFSGTRSLGADDVTSARAPFALARPRLTDAALLRRVPKRSSPEIPIVAAAPLAAATTCWQLDPPREALTLVVKATFDLVAGARATIREEPDALSGDVYAGDDLAGSLVYASDFAISKVRADVVLTGHACAPGGSATSARVTFRFGDPATTGGFERAVDVLGDRVWSRVGIAMAPGDPAPFERMPLVYERAFGGPGFAANPVGIPLPNLEDPDHRIQAPGRAASPACFAPIPPLWKERWSKLGTFDAAWLASRWPYFPADFDAAHFQAAPRSQQLEQIRGDETYRISGAGAEVLGGALPGLRARAFALLGAGDLVEISLRLDTAAFDADEAKVNLVWRGSFEVSDEEAPEIETLFVCTEELARDPRPLEEIRALLVEAVAPSGPEDEVASERAPPPPPDPAARAAAREALLTRVAAGEALDGADLADAELVDLDLRGRSLVGANLKGAVLRGCCLAGADLSGAVLAGADLTDADLTGAVLAGADLVGATLAAAILDEADLEGADLSGVRAPGASFRRARGEAVQLASGTFTDARFDDARLAGADFTEAKLDRAGFEGAALPEVRLYHASGEGARFDGARLDEARCDDANLVKCSFAGAHAPSSVWEKATISGSVFTGANLAGASFSRATCEGVVFHRVDAREARFMRARLAGAELVGANLLEADFERADLGAADLRGANLHGAETWRAKLGGAKLDRAIVTATKLGGRA